MGFASEYAAQIKNTTNIALGISWGVVMFYAADFVQKTISLLETIINYAVSTFKYVLFLPKTIGQYAFIDTFPAVIAAGIIGILLIPILIYAWRILKKIKRFEFA